MVTAPHTSLASDSDMRPTLTPRGSVPKFRAS